MRAFKTFEYQSSDREAFRAGALPRSWRKEYPSLFDQQDVRLALNQPNNHFFEWYAAIRIFAESGYLSLLEKYHFKSHTRKYRRFGELAPPRVFYAATLARQYTAQPPDLFTYDPASGDWYFCEVKGPGGRFRPSQSFFFAVLEDVSGKPVNVIRFREARRHRTGGTGWRPTTR